MSMLICSYLAVSTADTLLWTRDKRLLAVAARLSFGGRLFDSVDFLT